MRIRRFLLTCLVLFAVALAWNALVHLVFLRAVNAEVQHLFRTDLARKIWLSLAGPAMLIILFHWGSSRFARNATVREGALWGLFFALVAGVLADLNQHVLYPIPAWVAGVWWAGGRVEFTLYGVITSRVYPAPVRKQ